MKYVFKIMMLLAVVFGMTTAYAAGGGGISTFWFPEAVTPVAEDVIGVHVEFFIIITVLFFIAFAFIMYSVMNHTKSKGHKAVQFDYPVTKAQWAGFILPFIGLFLLDYVVMGIPAYHAAVAMEDTQANADMVLKVTGSQWKWTYEYPAEGIKFVSTLSTPKDQINGSAAKGDNYLLEVDNRVMLPVHKKVRIIMMSSDVVHSWSVPAFAVKRATVPGFLREAWVNIDKEGVYTGQCSQICGKGHPFMPIVVEAVSEAKYKDWVAKKQAENAAREAEIANKDFTKEELVTMGKGVYEKNCATCHQVNGAGLPGVFPAITGSKVVNQKMLDADGKLVKDAHLDRVMNGKAGTAMPAWKNSLNDIDIAAVVAYERNALGNSQGDIVQPKQVKALR